MLLSSHKLCVFTCMVLLISTSFLAYREINSRLSKIGRGYYAFATVLGKEPIPVSAEPGLHQWKISYLIEEVKPNDTDFHHLILEREKELSAQAKPRSFQVSDEWASHIKTGDHLIIEMLTKGPDIFLSHVSVTINGIPVQREQL